MANNVQKNIKQISTRTCASLSEKGVDAIKELFGEGKTMQERLKIDTEKEYIKKMLVAQMDLGGMLLTHKYYSRGFEGISEFREESDKIIEKTQTESILTFDNDTLELLFGNSLGIMDQEEVEKWKKVLYGDGCEGKDLITLYAEEKFKSEYQNEENIIKKFIKSFKYKKLFKQDALEDSHTKKMRGLLSEEIVANPEENASFIITDTINKIDQGIAEYTGLKEVESISEITLNSLEQLDETPINIENECEKTRKILNEKNPSKFDINYRKKQVTLGTERGVGAGEVIETIPYEEIPKAMQELQQRYEIAYNTSENDEKYIKEITSIYADFVYIQPYEDGNKRTATCLFNKMLLSKGIIPPPISLANGDQELGQAFEKARDKDYTMLQEMIFSKYESMKATMGEIGSLETSEKELDNKRENEEVER